MIMNDTEVVYNDSVTQLSMTNSADGEISLYEAMLLASGDLGRPVERHLPCESVSSGEPGYCGCPQQREEDFGNFYDSDGNPTPGGPLFRDFITVQARLSGGTMAVGGYGILIENGANSNLLGPRQVYQNAKGGIRLDGPGTENNVIGKHYKSAPFLTNPVLPSLVYENGAGNNPNRHGVHISNGASRNTIELMNVAGNQGDGVFIEGPETTFNRCSGVWTGFIYFFKDAAEPTAMPNSGNSVHIASGAPWNMIGGYSIVRNNLSNDALNGVLIEGVDTSNNIVRDTDIGRTPMVNIIDPESGRTYERQHYYQQYS
ncbi:MAG: right-handed parallel beta-helix repeat-containing protein [Deltaproteobacteria bacterium]|nr:right-handed parallel beta-helix repeat-containing protein [Deltaproteobacteria bacterium]MBW2137712.1 right-handed parallel beta-helix repeat-containing protein [Deltaproteobacteria bacterium]